MEQQGDVSGNEVTGGKGMQGIMGVTEIGKGWAKCTWLTSGIWNSHV